MFHLIVRNADAVLETRHIANPAQAARAWANMRSGIEYDTKPVMLIATWKNRAFLRHRFDVDEHNMDYVPADNDMTPLFYLAMAGGITGMGDAVKSPGRPHKGSAREINWSMQDWSLSDAEMARALGVTRQAVSLQRKRHAK